MRKQLWFLILIIPVVVWAKSYYYPQIKTEIYFEKDGSAHILQQRTYAFEGSFSYAFVDLKKQGAENIILKAVCERTNGDWKILEPEIVDSPKSLYIRWGYSAHNEIKTFLLDYTIFGAVIRFQDVSEFYWKFIEDQHENIHDIKLELFLPQSSSELFKVYIHSKARPGMLTFSDAFDKAIIEQKNIPQDAYVEVRMLTSPSIFPNAALQSENRYKQILSQEKRNFLVSTLRKFVLFPIGLVLMFILPVVLLLVFYFRYGREPKIQYIGMYEHEPPRNITPVLIPAILHQKPDKTWIYKSVFRGMFASLLDLTMKGLITIQELKDNHKSHYRFNLAKPEKTKELEPLSQEVLNFFFETAGGNQNVVTDKTLKVYADKYPMEFQRFLAGLYKRTVDWWKDRLGGTLLDVTSSKIYNIYILCILPAIIVGALLTGSGLSLLIGVPNPICFVIPIFVGIALFFIFTFTGRSILRWSPQAYLEQKRWLNFRRFLSDFSAIEQAPITLLPIWEHYFVYAVALGVAQRFMKNITDLATKQGTPVVLPVWYVAATTNGPTGFASMQESLSNFNAFASNFTNMMNSFSTAASHGGGFSGGGGGGGGGGSSGAG